MTDLNSLMIFAKVVEAKGFSEAARRLKMPTSTVSRGPTRGPPARTLDLRLTDVGSEVLEHAQHSAQLSEAVDNASNHLSTFLRRLGPRATQHLRLVACTVGRRIPGVLANVRVAFITDRIVDQIAKGVDLVFKIGEQLKDSSLVARRILTVGVRSSRYTSAKCKAPKTPGSARPSVSFWTPENSWNFAKSNGKRRH